MHRWNALEEMRLTALIRCPICQAAVFSAVIFSYFWASLLLGLFWNFSHGQSMYSNFRNEVKPFNSRNGHLLIVCTCNWNGRTY